MCAPETDKKASPIFVGGQWPDEHALCLRVSSAESLWEGFAWYPNAPGMHAREG